MKVTRLAHINSYYLSNKLHAELVENIQLEDPEMEQVVYVPLLKSSKAETDNKAPDRVQVIISACFTQLSRYIWPLKIRQVYKDFKSKIGTTEITVTHSHSLISNGIISYFMFRFRKIPYIVTVRNTDINIFLKRSFLFRKLGEKILKSASSVVVLSPAYRDLQLKKYISSGIFESLLPRLHVIPNGVNDFWIDNVYTSRKKIDGVVEILFVGKLRPNKNLSGLINSCAILAEKGIKLRLTIAGDGELKDQILGQGHNFEINYLGFVGTKEELIQVYRKCHLLAVPSFKESFGLVYVEAMTQGLPVIYTSGQGFDGNFEEGKVGYSVIATDYQGIAEKIEAIINDYEQISSNAIEASLGFSWKSTSERLMKLYRKAI